LDCIRLFLSSSSVKDINAVSVNQIISLRQRNRNQDGSAHQYNVPNKAASILQTDSVPGRNHDFEVPVFLMDSHYVTFTNQVFAFACWALRLTKQPISRKLTLS
jgi:hypothetical protein